MKTATKVQRKLAPVDEAHIIIRGFMRHASDGAPLGEHRVAILQHFKRAKIDFNPGDVRDHTMIGELLHGTTVALREVPEVDKATIVLSGFYETPFDATPLGEQRNEVVKHLRNVGLEVSFGQFGRDTLLSDVLNFIDGNAD